MIVTLRQEAATAEKSKQTNEKDNNDQNMANRTEILARIQVAKRQREEGRSWSNWVKQIGGHSNDCGVSTLILTRLQSTRRWKCKGIRVVHENWPK